MPRYWFWISVSNLVCTPVPSPLPAEHHLHFQLSFIIKNWLSRLRFSQYPFRWSSKWMFIFTLEFDKLCLLKINILYNFLIEIHSDKLMRPQTPTHLYTCNLHKHQHLHLRLRWSRWMEWICSRYLFLRSLVHLTSPSCFASFSNCPSRVIRFSNLWTLAGSFNPTLKSNEICNTNIFQAEYNSYEYLCFKTDKF